MFQNMPDSMKDALAARIVPHAPPQLFDNPYTDDQHRRVLDVIRGNGPWPLIIAQHFASVEELIATSTGSGVDGVSLDDFVTPTFRGYLAKDSICYYPEIEDLFYNSNFMARIRAYWGAEYALPDQLLFNLNGACDNFDPAHLDAAEYRGISHSNSPTWLMNTMAKSGLFREYQRKKAQIVTWFYRSSIGGGFTYWPNGIRRSPERLAAPMWNKAVIVENEMMFHRGEPNGPEERRHPKGLAFHSMIGADPHSDGWVITTDDHVIDHVADEETRFLLHWSGDLFMDKDELRLTMDHKDDLTHERVFDMFISDLRKRGVSFVMPGDPLHDPAFIMTLTQAYDIGEPLYYPSDAPGPRELRRAA